MGNDTSFETRADYQLGQTVDVAYMGNKSAYYPAKIVRKHDCNRYDVRFEFNAKIVTVFSDDIKGYGRDPQFKETKQTKKQSENRISLSRGSQGKRWFFLFFF